MADLPLLILRPQPGADQTAARAKEMGLAPVIAPLFAAEALPWDAPDPARYDALLLTSANALRHGGRQLSAYQHLPAFVVGEKTAAMARARGFAVAAVSATGLDDLLPELAKRRQARVLRLAGENHIMLAERDDLPRIDLVTVYRAAAQPLAQEAIAVLSAENVTLLHSARAAATLVSEMERCALSRKHTHIIAISAATVAAARHGWASISSAAEPTDLALLASASRLCRGVSQ
ncbi:MAG: uroporphyrinogen-III synthase [Parasphingorhabdus sp.]|nr:uroporphyrinogen-III synthase [Parasphingorhabdus sp.]